MIANYLACSVMLTKKASYLSLCLTPKAGGFSDPTLLLPWEMAVLLPFSWWWWCPPPMMPNRGIFTILIMIVQWMPKFQSNRKFESQNWRQHEPTTLWPTWEIQLRTFRVSIKAEKNCLVVDFSSVWKSRQNWVAFSRSRVRTYGWAEIGE